MYIPISVYGYLVGSFRNYLSSNCSLQEIYERNLIHNVTYYVFFQEDFLINKKYLQKKRKTDISNTVRKIVEKQKRKVSQP